MEHIYSDENNFEIHEETDENQRRILTKICGRNRSFAVPDGVYALSRDAFSEVTETMRYIFIPKSVMIIPENTFNGFRGNLICKRNGKELHELDILCEAEVRPEGFFVHVSEETFEEDYTFYTEYRYRTWCGGGVSTCSEEKNESFNGEDLYGLLAPHVHFGVSFDDFLRFCKD
ncbi:MAG: hypothetical protein IJK40_09445 [Clostridia bacterium]|nr:hypothetical protein [Clostridia bacterium]